MQNDVTLLNKKREEEDYVTGCTEFHVNCQSSVMCTHHHDVARPVLDGAKEAEDDNYDVEEVGKDWGPLVTQEVKDLSL